MIEMFEYDFMQRAFLAGIIISIISAIAGSFVVLKRYSLLADTLAHVSLVGVSIAILLDTSPVYMAIIVSVIAAWMIEYLRSYHKIYSDSILAIFLSGSLALSVIIISVANEFNSSLFAYLFGSILAVSSEDLILISIAGVLLLAIFVIFFRSFFFIAFDEEAAQTSGVLVKWLNFLLVTLVAIIIALSIRIVGTLLIGALMVIPVISALRFKKGFFHTVIIALAISLISVISGLSLSYHYSLPSGATIVAVVLGMFIASMLINRRG